MITKNATYDLIATVMDNSKEKDWEKAKHEWRVTSYYHMIDARCICGHDHINHCYVIENQLSGKTLQPIGSSCIKKFQSNSMVSEMDFVTRIGTLKKAFDQHVSYGAVKSVLNQELIDFFDDNHVFGSDSEYDFVSDMIRKRKEPSAKQQKWLNSIIFYKIKPFIVNLK